MNTNAETFLEIVEKLKGSPSDKVYKLIELYSFYSRACTDVIGRGFFENYDECKAVVDGVGSVDRFIHFCLDVGISPVWRVDKYIELYTGLNND